MEGQEPEEEQEAHEGQEVQKGQEDEIKGREEEPTTACRRTSPSVREELIWFLRAEEKVCGYAD